MCLSFSGFFVIVFDYFSSIFYLIEVDICANESNNLASKKKKILTAFIHCHSGTCYIFRANYGGHIEIHFITLTQFYFFFFCSYGFAVDIRAQQHDAIAIRQQYFCSLELRFNFELDLYYGIGLYRLRDLHSVL